jgi:hypothetical protein
MELENIISTVSQVQKDKVHVVSHVWERANTNTSIIIYTYKHIQNMFVKVGLLEETKGGGKEEKNDIE